MRWKYPLFNHEIGNSGLWRMVTNQVHSQRPIIKPLPFAGLAWMAVKKIDNPRSSGYNSLIIDIL
jgi:hypothetical protein